MIVIADGFEFDFRNAIDAFVFDEKDKDSPNYHGVPMKGVDIIAEFVNEFVYVEIKEYSNPSSYNPNLAHKNATTGYREKNFQKLKSHLKYKFRDTYLFRHAEQKVHKPVHYVCLITFPNAQNIHLAKELARELPVGRASQRWIAPLAKSCQVLNELSWNRNFPQWPVTRLPKNNSAGGTTP